MKKPARKPRILVRDMFCANPHYIREQNIPKGSAVGFNIRLLFVTIPSQPLPIYYN